MLKISCVLNNLVTNNHRFNVTSRTCRNLTGTKKIKSRYLSKKKSLAILLHINPIVAFAINDTNIYNNNQYNT